MTNYSIVVIHIYLSYPIFLTKYSVIQINNLLISMLNPKYLVLILLIPCFLAGKNMTITCGKCNNTPSGCGSAICYQYTAASLTPFESCTNTTACDITGTVTVTLNPCALDYQGQLCSTNICFYLSTIIIGTTNSNCTTANYSVNTSCTTTSSCTTATPNCTNCMQVISSKSGSAVTSYVCTSTYKTNCYNGTSSARIATCNIDTFGIVSNCCTTYSFAGSNTGMCTSSIAGLSSPDAQSKLSTWVNVEHILIMTISMVVGLMI